MQLNIQLSNVNWISVWSEENTNLWAELTVTFPLYLVGRARHMALAFLFMPFSLPGRTAL
jgi:hypothetical protein